MRGKAWLKFFGLSFFSDKQASSAPRFGFVPVALNIALAFVFFMCGYYAADVVPFSSHYAHATAYKEFVENAFSRGLEISVLGKKAVCGAKINAYVGDDEYAANGYKLIVDTRDSDMLVQFTQVGVKGEDEISYEEYRALSDAQKKEYKIETRYTDERLTFTEDTVAKYEAFLSADEKGKTAYEKLDKAADDYNEQLYYTYVKHYYVAANSVQRGAKAPVLRDYYYNNFISGGKTRYLYVFDDMIAGSFETDAKIPIVFGGYFNKCKDGQITDIHRFIKDVYYDTAGHTFGSYFLSAMSLLPMIILVPLLLSLVVWAIGKTVKKGWEKTYGGCLKIVYSFVWVSALITALLLFALSWAVGARLLYSYIPVMFGGMLILRTAIHCIAATVKNAKQSAETEQNGNEIFEG